MFHKISIYLSSTISTLIALIFLLGLVFSPLLVELDFDEKPTPLISTILIFGTLFGIFALAAWQKLIGHLGVLMLTIFVISQSGLPIYFLVIPFIILFPVWGAFSKRRKNEM